MALTGKNIKWKTFDCFNGALWELSGVQIQKGVKCESWPEIVWVCEGALSLKQDESLARCFSLYFSHPMRYLSG